MKALLRADNEKLEPPVTSSSHHERHSADYQLTDRHHGIKGHTFSHQTHEPLRPCAMPTKPSSVGCS
eukprot:scaffold2603_cov100-Isochrysis_galbana.AAC.8